MNINKQELNILNGKPTRPNTGRAGNTIYSIAKFILKLAYIITCVICSIIEAVCWSIAILTLPKRKRKSKRWF